MLFRRRGARRYIVLIIFLCTVFALLSFFGTISPRQELNSDRKQRNQPTNSLEKQSDVTTLLNLNDGTLSTIQNIPIIIENKHEGLPLRRVQSTKDNTAADAPVLLPKELTHKPIKKEGPWNQWVEKCALNPKQPTLYNHTEFGFNIEERDICQGEVFLLMFIQSKVDHRDRRDIIRRTYGSLENVDNFRVRLIFVLGMTTMEQQNNIVQESQQYRDIVQSNHLDHYRNLTYSHLTAFNWILRNCEQAKFVLKLDDDTFVNLPHVITLLTESLQNRRNFFYCHQAEVNKPIREKGVKWSVSLSEWPAESFPPHCKGFGYLMSTDVIEKLLYCSYFLPYFWIDDVFVSGELRKRVDIELQTMFPGFEYAWLLPHHGSDQITDYIFLVGRYNEMSKRIWYKIWRASLSYYYQ